MEPHVLDYDPHSGDYGLGFFGCSLQSGSYFVNHPNLGLLCYLCNMETTIASVSGRNITSTGATTASAVTIKPVDLYRRRVFLEPLALYLTLDAGTFESVVVDMAAKKLTIAFNTMAFDNSTFTARRLRVEKTSTSRPGIGFKVAFPVERNAYVIPEAKISGIEVTWN
jgi:hypothetical protein